MINIDDVNEIKKCDPKNVYESTGLFIDQCKLIHELVEGIEFSNSHEDVANIVFSGMGGSAYGAQIAVSLFKDDLGVPALINNDYILPFSTSSESLVIPTSYSGGTEETLNSFADAKAKNAYIVGLTSGGKLAELLKADEYDAVVFDPKFNPSGQPRLGTGYIVLGTIEILRKMKLVHLNSDEVTDSISEVEKNHETIKQDAKELSKKIYSKIPVIFASSFLSGNAHVIRNQFNETAKSFSSYHVLPEANHHLMEGLKNPQNSNLITLFLDSALYAERLNKRVMLTKEVVQKNNIEVLSYQLTGKSKLSQVLEILLFGSYLTFYLAILYGQDPSVIPWVDYFKDKLKT